MYTQQTHTYTGLLRWDWSPLAIWSLAEMLEIPAYEMTEIMTSLQTACNIAVRTYHEMHDNPIASNVDQGNEYIKDSLYIVIQQTDSLSLILKDMKANAALDRCNYLNAFASEERDALITGSNDNPNDLPLLKNVFTDLETSLHDFLHYNKFLFLDQYDISFWEETGNDLFGDDPKHIIYNGGIRDYRGACKCMAVGQATACAFHICRLLEFIVKIIWKSTNSQNCHIELKGWGEYEAKLRNFKENPPNHQGPRRPNWPDGWDNPRKKFYDRILADLVPLRPADRNQVMHENVFYSDYEAKTLIITSQNIIRHALEHIDASGNYKP